MRTLAPVIKWSGGKRRLAPFVGALFPAAERYFEPFVGGGALLPFRTARNAVASDVIPELIALWEMIRDEPELVLAGYRERWERLRADGHTVFYDTRDDFNAHRSPVDFLFLSRTCVNGLIRFNEKGEFNNSLHHTRPGIAPERLGRVFSEWSVVLAGVTFRCEDYRVALSDACGGDFAFLDPPYAGTRGRYRREEFDQRAFFEQLATLNDRGVKWLLTYDGTAGDRDYRSPVPEELYRHYLTADSGASSFPRLMSARTDAVQESVFLNYDPPTQLALELA